jgi:hypothetical protein
MFSGFPTQRRWPKRVPAGRSTGEPPLVSTPDLTTLASDAVDELHDRAATLHARNHVRAAFAVELAAASAALCLAVADLLGPPPPPSPSRRHRAKPRRRDDQPTLR